MARKPAPAPPPPIPAIYLRVSTEDQATSGYGLDVQLERCTAQATVKGWSVEPGHIFADEGISGTKDESERPGLAALLAAIDAGMVNVVIVLALDRLGRRTKIVLDLVDRITAAGAELVSCKESLDTSTPAGMFVTQMFAALAQLDHSNIVKRLTDGRNARYVQDGERGGPLPYGYVRTADGVVVDDQAAALVRLMFAQRSAGATLRAIAHELNQHAPGGRGGQWYAATVRGILDNERTYRGQRGPGGAAWPVILSETGFVLSGG